MSRTDASDLDDAMKGFGGVDNAGCKCKSCVAACEYKPGWFLHGEAEKAAALMGLCLPDFFRRYLMVDWYEDWDGVDRDEDLGDVFVLSPAVVGGSAGEEFPGDPRGRCVFLKDDLCEIHDAKPHECRMHIHGEGKTAINLRKRAITAAWADKQAHITELLGRWPESEYFGW